MEESNVAVHVASRALVTGDLSLGELAGLFDDIGRRLSAPRDGTAVMELLVSLAVDQVPAAEYAGITVGGGDAKRFRTVAASDELVRRVDDIQYELGNGPCVDALVKGTVFHAANLRTDTRWPEFGPRAVEQTGIVSMFSLRLYLEYDVRTIAGLNLYNRQPDAFDDLDTTIALLLATHGALALGMATAHTKAVHLEQALKTSRDIGIAMGILMDRHKVTRDQAFDLLRITSQHTHRNLADLAGQVADTGELPDVNPVRKPAEDVVD
jgi:ANTAR domain/GAF domain